MSGSVCRARYRSCPIALGWFRWLQETNGSVLLVSVKLIREGTPALIDLIHPITGLDLRLLPVDHTLLWPELQ